MTIECKNRTTILTTQHNKKTNYVRNDDDAEMHLHTECNGKIAHHTLND